MQAYPTEGIQFWEGEMYTELLNHSKTQEIEREMSRIRLVSLAEKAASPRHRPSAAPKRRAAPALPLRLLRALRPAS